MNALFLFVGKLFDTSAWPAKWLCGTWTETEGWLYIISQGVIAVACIICCFAVYSFTAENKRRATSKRLRFPSVFLLACGIAFCMEALAFWVPLYRVNLIVLIITAITGIVSLFRLTDGSPVAEDNAIQQSTVDDERLAVVRQEAIVPVTEEVVVKKQVINPQEHGFKTIVERSTTAVTIMDAEMVAFYANAGARALADGGGITDGNWTTLLHPADTPVFHKAFEAALAMPGTAINACVRIINDSKGHVWINGTICNMQDEPGIGGVVLSFTDVTESQEAHAELRKLNDRLEKNVAERTMQLEATTRELEAFSYSVSHDMRAPLRIISGYTEMIHADHGEKLDTEAKRLLDVIVTNTRHMNGMIDALLSLARVGKKDLMVLPADMASIVKSVVNEQVAMSGSAARFELGNIIPVPCDSVLIRNVWSNLISNAIKYSSKQPQAVITIGSQMMDGKVAYYVRDNGAGFDMQYAQKLFGVFQRLHRRADYDGNGVGLALVQRIVLKHGGYVWAEGAENKGATFYFTLPVK